MSRMAYSIRPIKLIYYFPSVRVIVPLYKRLTINGAVGLVEILVYCRVGQSAIFGVILTFINPFFISFLLQVRERPHYAISRHDIRLVDGVIDGIIRLNHGIIRPDHGIICPNHWGIGLNHDYSHGSAPTYILGVSRDLRDAGKKDDRRK